MMQSLLESRFQCKFKGERWESKRSKCKNIDDILSKQRYR